MNASIANKFRLTLKGIKIAFNLGFIRVFSRFLLLLFMRTELAICEGLVFSVWVPILSQIDRKNAKKTRNSASISPPRDLWIVSNLLGKKKLRLTAKKSGSHQQKKSSGGGGDGGSGSCCGNLSSIHYRKFIKMAHCCGGRPHLDHHHKINNKTTASAMATRSHFSILCWCCCSQLAHPFQRHWLTTKSKGNNNNIRQHVY